MRWIDSPEFTFWQAWEALFGPVHPAHEWKTGMMRYEVKAKPEETPDEMFRRLESAFGESDG